jgi:invasion protein IalB
MQSVMAEDRPNVGLTVIVLKTADQKSRLMRVVAPMGVLLPPGLGLKIDQTDAGRAGFVRCLTTGCVAEWRCEVEKSNHRHRLLRPASGHAAAARPSSAMNSRRLIGEQ